MKARETKPPGFVCPHCGETISTYEATKRQQKAYYLVYLLRKSQKEAARIMGITPPSLHCLLKRLRKHHPHVFPKKGKKRQRIVAKKIAPSQKNNNNYKLLLTKKLYSYNFNLFPSKRFSNVHISFHYREQMFFLLLEPIPKPNVKLFYKPN
jgi:hypothetical protein